MAVPSTATDFLQVVQESGLIDHDSLAAAVDRLGGDDTFRAQPRQIAQRLVADGLITPFQAEQLLLGNWHGFTIGKFRIVDQLGSGSSGVVYLVEQPDLHRRVAVKVLPLGGDVSPSLVQRFRREARALALLDHVNVVHVYDFDQDRDRLFLVMEYVEGVTLHDWVKRNGRLPVTHACHYARQAARGLQAIHEAGLVHRDVKPNNVMLDAAGVVKILDLGLARFLGEEGDSPTMKYDSRRVLGTADFLSPEQALNSHEVDIRADVYSLGATLYFLLTGQTPFPTGTVVQKLLWLQTQRPAPAHEVNPEVPPALGEVVARMMAREPADRYPTPLEVVRALGPWTQTPIPPPDFGPLPAHRQRLSGAGSSHLELIRPEDDHGSPTDGPAAADHPTPVLTAPLPALALLRQSPAAAEPEDPDCRVELAVAAGPDGASEFQAAPATAAPEPEGEAALSWQLGLVLAALLVSVGVGIALALGLGH